MARKTEDQRRRPAQPSGKRWYEYYNPKAGESSFGTFKPGSQPRGYKPVSKATATALSAREAKQSSTRAMNRGQAARAAAKKSAVSEARKTRGMARASSRAAGRTAANERRKAPRAVLSLGRRKK